MAINNRIDIGAAPILWSNVKHAFTIVNDNFSNITLNDLTDVNTEENPLSIGDVLTWTGNQWEPIVSGGVAAPAGIGWDHAGSNDELRISSTFTELNEEYLIREVRINNDGLLEIELATFNPNIAAYGQNLYWDEPATEFSIHVDNPSDFTTQFIASVDDIIDEYGVHPVITDYDVGTQSAVPAGGVNWHQTFNTNNIATIHSDGAGLNGGFADAKITVKDDQDIVWGDGFLFVYHWQNVGANVNFTDLTGQTFLGKYNTINYIVDITGLSNINNSTTTLSPAGGTLSDINNSGTMTFTEPIHKDNNDGSRSIALNTQFTRPAEVTGITYDIIDTDFDNIIHSEFTYPSFYIWTINNTIPPTRDDIVTNNEFSIDVGEFGDQVHNISTFINNNAGQARCFWFAVRSNTTQPTSFETGPTSSLLSTVSVRVGNTVQLEPDIPDPGYIPEEYTLYGITLQPGDTFVRIS